MKKQNWVCVTCGEDPRSHVINVSRIWSTKKGKWFSQHSFKGKIDE